MAAFNIWRPLSKNITILSYKKEKNPLKNIPPSYPFPTPPPRSQARPAHQREEEIGWESQNQSWPCIRDTAPSSRAWTLIQETLEKVMEGHPHGSAQEHFRLKANLLKEMCLASVQARRPPGQC